MTMTEILKCHFCQAAATAIKLDSTVEPQEGPDGVDLPDTIVTERLPICDDCAEEWYDGTEIHPGTLPL